MTDNPLEAGGINKTPKLGPIYVVRADTLDDKNVKGVNTIQLYEKSYDGRIALINGVFNARELKKLGMCLDGYRNLMNEFEVIEVIKNRKQ